MGNVSIIMPLYNAEKYVAESITSVIRQSYDDWELIIVDDGSSDSSFEIAKSYESEKIKIYSQRNKGASAARNLGLKHSTGEYIQFLDADDLLDEKKIEIQLSVLKSSPTGTISSCQWGRFTDKIETAVFKPEKVWSNYHPVEWLIDSWEGLGMMQTACWLVPRTVLERAGLWDERLTLNDDGEFFCRILLNSSTIEFANDAVVYYRSGLPTSLSQQKSIKARESAFEVCESYKRHMLNVCDTPKSRHAIMKNYLRYIYEFYPSPKELMDLSVERIEELGFYSMEAYGGNSFKRIALLIGMMNTLKLRTLAKKIKPSKLLKND